MLFGKKTSAPRLEPPVGMGIGDVRTERSICTGEMTIGFYDRHTRRLVQSRFVRGDKDIAAFYAAYGWQPPAGGPKEAGPGQ